MSGGFHEIPDTWLWTRVDEAGFVQLGRQRSPQHHSGEHMRPYLRVANVYENHIDTRDVLKMNFTPAEAGRYLLSHGDILLNEGQSKELVGRPAMFRNEVPGACFQNTLVRFRAYDHVVPEYALSLFRYYLRAGHFQSVCKWTTNIAHLGAERFSGMPFPLAPLPEQKRIADKLDALLARVDACRERLDRVPGTLKRFRQSVLAAATSGELTREWREQRGQSQTNWVASTVEQVCEQIVDCPHSTPKWTMDGEVCLRTTNLFVTGLYLGEVRRVSETTYKERTARLIPTAGDIVYSREGGILGIACEIPVGLRTCLGQRMMLMRPRAASIRSGFLALVLNAPSTTAVVRELTGGTASPHLNVGDIKRFTVPLPTTEEQDAILERTDALLGVASAIEHRVNGAVRTAERLRESALATAFRGDLVPQVPSDEPASQLIERCREPHASEDVGMVPGKARDLRRPTARRRGSARQDRD